MKPIRSHPTKTQSRSLRTLRPLERGLTALSIMAAATCARAQTLHVIAPLAGGAYGHPFGVSANGSVVAAANVLPSGDIDHGLTWTRGGGSQAMGDLPGYTLATFPRGISGDGSTVVGLAFDPDFNTTGFRYRSGVMGNLGSLGGPGSSSNANGVNHDGSVVTGDTITGTSQHAYRWTSAGMQDLGVLPGGTYSLGLAISGNGGVIVGNGDADGAARAYRWTQADGMVPLIPLPGSGFDGAYAVSADGTTIAGVSDGLPVRWRNDVPESLGALAGLSYLSPSAVSADGLMIGGAAFGGDKAFLWTQSAGLMVFEDVLTARGMDLTGWNLSGITGMSADGSTLVGYGTFEGETRGWVLTEFTAVPEIPPLPVAAGLVGFACVYSTVRARRQRRA